MGELWAASTLARCPHAGRARSNVLIYGYVAGFGKLDPRFLEPNAGGVGRTSHRYEQVLSFDRAFAIEPFSHDAHTVARLPFDSADLGVGAEQ